MFETALQWLDALRGKAVSAREAVEAAYARIGTCEPRIHAFLSLQNTQAMADADAIDAQRAAGLPLGRLAGLPVAIKDNICDKGIECRCASRVLEGYIPPYHATVVAKLRAAGAIIIGRTNLDEFAMGSSTENSGYQVTCNPWDIERIPGGSSGGSAAAVAAREVPAAFGSDTGGSIRQPAALCGVTGLKPTYGRVSRNGLVAYGSSLDQIGPLTLDVRDAALMLSVIAGHDPGDSTSAEVPVADYAAALHASVAGMKIGVPREYFVSGIDPQVAQAVRAALANFEKAGAEIIEISLPHTEYAIPTYYIVATAEASSNLARYDGIHYGRRAPVAKDLWDVYTKSRREGFGDEVIRRVLLGTYVLSSGYYDAYYLKALKVRTLIKRDFDAAFERVDVIATPTSPTAAFKTGEKADDPLQMYLSDIFTVSVNLAGIPGMSIPCGFTDTGLPIGLQLLARPFGEPALIRAGSAYQQATDFHTRRPAQNGIAG